MSSTIPSADVLMTAVCEDCGWEYERSPEAGDDLTSEQNRDIATRVVRSHSFRCETTGEWGDTATVEFDMTGGSP